jgi:hypothetical protein
MLHRERGAKEAAIAACRILLCARPCMNACRRVANRYFEQAACTILNNIPFAGSDWGWFAFENMPLLHLCPVRGPLRGRARVDLELAGGRRAYLDDPRLSSEVSRTIKTAVLRARDQIEAAWVVEMHRRGWLTAGVDGDHLVLVAYPREATQFLRVLHAEDVGVTALNPGDIGVDPKTADLVVGVGRPAQKQRRMFLPDLLWRD